MKRTLIEHAAPTLAGLKTANMFNYKFKSKEQLTEELILLNRELNEKGLYLMFFEKVVKPFFFMCIERINY